jgi:1,4-alpha-glucan branching enzyme
MRRPAFIILALALGLGLAGCSSLNFIKRRLPPPTVTDEGVLFRFYAPSAQLVQLAGEWPENNWLRGQAQTQGFLVGQMEDNDKDGVWTRLEKLPPGRYQYKFHIDRVNWKEDPNNPQRTDDGYGGFNSIVEVK